jgi:hypothetical protein
MLDQQYARAPMATIDKLDELPELLLQLEVRNLYNSTKEFLEEQTIKCGPGWTRIEQAILKLRGQPSFDAFLDAFEKFVRDAVLVTQKHVFVLVDNKVAPASLLPSLSAGVRRDYLAGRPPERGEPVAQLLEKRKIGRAQVFTYVTSRPVKQTDKLEASDLSPGVRKKYKKKNAKIQARYIVEMRCYDQIVLFDNTALLLLDAPKGVDAKVLMQDEIAYNLLLRAQLNLDPKGGEMLFIDLFPAVDRIWRDGNEGIVNQLKFVSNGRAEIGGKFSITSTDDYRKQKFQVSGAKGGAQVLPFWVSVRWPDRKRSPMVVLPGKSYMAMAGGDGGGTRVQLNYMQVPFDTGWDDFLFALDRVRQHLQD